MAKAKTKAPRQLVVGAIHIRGGNGMGLRPAEHHVSIDFNRRESGRNFGSVQVQILGDGQLDMTWVHFGSEATAPTKAEFDWCSGQVEIRWKQFLNELRYIVDTGHIRPGCSVAFNTFQVASEEERQRHLLAYGPVSTTQ